MPERYCPLNYAPVWTFVRLAPWPWTGRRMRRAAATSLLVTLWILLFLERSWAWFIYSESVADLRFAPWVYIGRTCEDIDIDPHYGEGFSPTVRIANTSSHDLKNVRGTVKYFGWWPGLGRAGWTFYFNVGDLPAGATSTFRPPPGAVFDNEGMTYVKVTSNRGVTLMRAYCSAWN